MSKTWSLEELAEESQRYLEDEGESKRIQWKPNGRQIRYYSTLGILDKPYTENGRTVWYGPRHLLQLLAIKKLQQSGMKLSEVQRSLTGATPDELRLLVGLPENFLSEIDDKVSSRGSPRRETSFWAARPLPVPPEEPKFQHIWRLEIEPGVTLTLDEKQASQLSIQEREQLAHSLAETWRNLKRNKAKE